MFLHRATHAAKAVVVTMGKWVTDDGAVVLDGNAETGDDEPHAENE
ncbi:hypothetical protein GCM10022222_00010 [Amycolatopsis ultiminotia]|uniref:Uncharacterized protein n=1 Tax=Amycolatopsis ultiminotia TaxID=543629 RepID=A0ABP6UWS7_9PSEU